VVNNLSDRPLLLVNEAANNNHWIGLQLAGTKSNRSALGAHVTVQGTAAGKPRVWVDEVRSGSSYNSSSDLRLHFGLGPQPKLTALTVRWPGGALELFPAPELDRFTTLVEGQGKPVPAVSPVK
jgi:hypothetical protein